MSVDMATIEELFICMLDDQNAKKQVAMMFREFKKEPTMSLHLGYAMQGFINQLCLNNDSATGAVMGFVAGVFMSRASENPELNQKILKDSITAYRNMEMPSNVLKFPKEWN